MYKILVVEDYPDNMALIEEILEDEGYQVLKAEDAEKGLKLLEDSQVDLVLMDISLPKMSGLEATRIIRETPGINELPVIALTAHAMKSDKDEAMAAGCSGYLTKPLDEALLLQTLMNFLN